jgi:hypothetical protein
MKQIDYKGLLLNYDYIKYSWLISTKTGELVARFTNLDTAKKFIDSLLSNG